MKGTIRERKKTDGTVSYICQVPAGRDPVTGRRRFKTVSPRRSGDAHKLIHALVAGGRGPSRNGRVRHR